MPHRQNNQHTIGNMVPYGKPAEVEIETLAPDKDGELTRYIERLPGYTSSSSDDVAKAGPDRGDFHNGRCSGRTGVGTTWTRDGRTWCRGCYRMRYGVNPTSDLLTKNVKRASRVTPPKKVTKADFGL